MKRKIGWLVRALPGLLLSSGLAACDLTLPKADYLPRSISAAPPSADGAALRRQLTEEEVESASRAGLLPRAAKSLLLAQSDFAHGDFIWEERGVPQGEVVIWVDLRRQMISVFRGGHEIGSAVALYGAGKKHSPLGHFTVLSRHEDYRSRTYNAPMPYSLFLTDDGVALHGSPMGPDRATHGCIGLPVEFARLLFEAAQVGDSVTILNSEPAVARERIRPAAG